VTRIAVLGAGVIGQVYAGRLAGAGHPTWMLARGSALAHLREHGMRLSDGRHTATPPVTVVGEADEIPPVDVAYLAVRGDQAAAALPSLAAVDARVVVTLANLAGEVDALVSRIGAERTVVGFPGVGGVRTPDGVRFHDVAQQATMLGRSGGREEHVAADLRGAGFAVDVVGDARSWLATHAVFIAGVGAAVLAAGSVEAVGRERARARAMVLSVRDGFRALHRRGVTVTPTPLRVIFTRMPLPVGTGYWAAQLRGELGRLTLAPHVLATRDTEFAYLADRVRELTGGDARLLNEALTRAGLMPSGSAPS